MKTLKNETLIESINPLTGEREVTSVIKHYKIPVKEQDQFFMSFLGLSEHLVNMKSALDIKILLWLCEKLEYNSPEVILNTNRRQELATKLNIKNPAISKSLKNLKELNLIFVDKSSVFINPFVFWKGTSQARNTLIKNNTISNFQ